MDRITAYLVICKDKPGDEPGRIRQEKMAEHFAHIEKSIDTLWIAGPLFDGDDITGSMMVLKADSSQQAVEMAKQDPYYAAGVWQSVEAQRFVAAAGDWVGGKTW